MTNTRDRWDETYTAKGDKVSWHQQGSSKSFKMIQDALPDKTASIIDVGAGSSRLPDDLIEADFRNITLLDISEVALSRTKERLAEGGNSVSYVIADINQWQPNRVWDLWHDRAVFHFLTDAANQDSYINALISGTRIGSKVIMSTFALTGPERCSGLPVQRYTAESLSARLGPKLSLYDRFEESHGTPFGTFQDFIYAGFERVG